MENTTEIKQKKVYTKRKDQLKTLAEEEKNSIQVEQKTEEQHEEKKEEKQEEKQEEKPEELEPDDPEPPNKRIRVTKEPEQQQPQANFLRGALLKPLMLAGIGALSFYVNNLYSTSTPVVQPNKPAEKKKIASPSFLQSAVHQSVMRRASVVSSGVQGFTKKTYN